MEELNVGLTVCAVWLSLLFTLLILKQHVAVHHDSTSQLVDCLLFFIAEAQDANSIL